MQTPEAIRHLRRALMLVLSVLILGTAGYMLFAQLSLADALSTTVVKMATLGNGVRPLLKPGRVFTTAVIVLGGGSLLSTLGVDMEYMIEGHLWSCPSGGG
jgi:voltage-gated potassium channel